MNTPKTTYEILLEKHGERYVQLHSISGYLGIEDETLLRRKALRSELGGIRPFKLVESQKAPLLVDLQNVADELDKMSRAAKIVCNN